MKLESLGYFRKPQCSTENNEKLSLIDIFQKTLQANGQIRRIEIATAYIDIEILVDLLDLIIERGDRRSGVKVRIFLDYQSACKLADELSLEETKKGKNLLKALKSTRLANKYGQDHDIRLRAVQLGTLFHSKAFALETNTHSASCVGSVNFTSRGFITNEEIAITETIEKSRLKKSKNLTIQVLDYFDKTLEQYPKNVLIPFEAIVEKRPTLKSTDFRELFLEGKLWYEDKEITPFTFPLDLPEKYRIRDAEIQGISIPHIESKLGNGLNVLKLINLDEKREDRARKSRWRRKYCLQTCLGLWAPNSWTPYIDEALEEKTEKKRAWFDSVVGYFNQNRDEVTSSICSAYSETWDQILRISDVNIKNHQTQVDLHKKAKDWVDKTCSRLNTDSFRQRVLTGISSVDMPDLWGGNQSDAKKFESSFFEQFEYELTRSVKRSQMAKNYLTQIGQEHSIHQTENLREKFILNYRWILEKIEEDSNNEDDDGEDE
jgi:hypothetical protein